MKNWLAERFLDFLGLQDGPTATQIELAVTDDRLHTSEAELQLQQQELKDEARRTADIARRKARGQQAVRELLNENSPRSSIEIRDFDAKIALADIEL